VAIHHALTGGLAPFRDKVSAIGLTPPRSPSLLRGARGIPASPSRRQGCVRGCGRTPFQSARSSRSLASSHSPVAELCRLRISERDALRPLLWLKTDSAVVQSVVEPLSLKLPKDLLVLQPMQGHLDLEPPGEVPGLRCSIASQTAASPPHDRIRHTLRPGNKCLADERNPQATELGWLADSDHCGKPLRRSDLSRISWPFSVFRKQTIRMRPGFLPSVIQVGWTDAA
jgi:hypothetical protein